MTGEAVSTALLWVGALGCGVMAGVYFAFSAFVMTALRALPTGAGMGAMCAIKRVILRSPFMPLFFGTSLAALLLFVPGVLGIWGAQPLPVLVGAAVYLFGMAGVTVAINVPLNTRLDRAGENGPQAEAVWRHYLAVWTRWNHLRAAASFIATALFTLALVRSG